MASHEDKYKAMQQPIEVKKEKVEIHDNEPCSSTCTNTQNDTHEIIKTLNYDEIVSSTEIVHQLQKAITDTNQRESEVCTKIKREIEQEKKPEGVLNHPSVTLDNLKFEKQQCSSSEPMAESNLDNFFQELSPDEIDQSIEIVKQLQKVLVNADGSRSAGECSQIHPDVKQEESNIVLSEPGNPLSEPFDDEIRVSMAIIKELQKSFSNSDETEKQREPSLSVQEIKEEKKCKSALTHSPIRLEEMKYAFQDLITGSKTDSENIYQDALRDDFKETFSDREVKIFCELISLMSPNSEDITQSTSLSYKEVEDISRIKEENIEINLNKSEFPEVSTSVDQHAEVNSEFMEKPEYFVCGSVRDSVTKKNVEVTTIREYGGEDEINIGQCAVKREMKKQLNKAEGEAKMELSREKQTMQTNSRKRRKNTNVCRGSKIQTKTCSKEKTKECDFCQKKFQHLCDLKRHVKMHTGQRPYKCEMCEYKCIQKSNFDKHLRTHSGERPYKCEICKQKFTEKGNLNRHMNTHSGERPYKCEICKNKFTEKGNLKGHMRTHSGERPYKCEICKHKFTHKGDLKRHMRTHSGERPFECEICKHKFTVKGSLNRHMKTHTRD